MKERDILNFVLPLLPITVVMNGQINGVILLLLSVYAGYIWIKEKKKVSFEFISLLLYFLIVIYSLFIDYIHDNLYFGHLELSLSSLFIPLIFFGLQGKFSVTTILYRTALFTAILTGILLLIGLFNGLTDQSRVHGLWTKEVTADFYATDHIINWGMLTYKQLISIFNIHPAYYGFLVNSSSVIAVYLLTIKKMKPNIGYSILGLNFIFIILLTSKANILAIIVLVILLFTQSFKYQSRKKNFVWLSLLAMFGILLVSIPSTRIRIQRSITTVVSKFDNNKVEKELIDNSTQERMKLWSTGLDIACQKSFMGWGITGGKIELANQSGINKNTHNQFIQIVLSSGFIGLIVFMFFILSPVIYSRFNRELVIGIVTLVIINLLFENFLNRQWGVLFISYFYSLLVLNKSQNSVQV